MEQKITQRTTEKAQRHTAFICYLSLLFLFFVVINNKTFALNIHSDTTSQTKLTLTQDSGFITLKEGLDFLLSNSLIDTAECMYFWRLGQTDTTEYVSFWKLCSQMDTIAKYYRKGKSDHYIMCIFECPMIVQKSPSLLSYDVIEINSDGELIKKERFLPAHWRKIDYYNGFSKYGDFFGITVFRIWVGAVDSYLFLFKDVIPQDSIRPILLLYDAPPEGSRCAVHVFTSKMDIKKDELIFRYKKEIDKQRKNGVWIKKYRTKKYTINYFYEDGKWIKKNKDIDKLKKLGKWTNRITKNIREK